MSYSLRTGDEEPVPVPVALGLDGAENARDAVAAMKNLIQGLDPNDWVFDETGTQEPPGGVWGPDLTRDDDLDYEDEEDDELDDDDDDWDEDEDEDDDWGDDDGDEDSPELEGQASDKEGDSEQKKDPDSESATQ